VITSGVCGVVHRTIPIVSNGLDRVMEEVIEVLITVIGMNRIIKSGI